MLNIIFRIPSKYMYGVKFDVTDIISIFFWCKKWDARYMIQGVRFLFFIQDLRFLKM